MTNIRDLMRPDFWKMISIVGWGERTTSSSSVKDYILKNYPPYKSNHFKALAIEIGEVLANKYIEQTLTKVAKYEVLMAAINIVAQGKNIYDKYVQDVSLLTPILENSDFNATDNFFINGIPTEDDYYASVVVLAD